MSKGDRYNPGSVSISRDGYHHVYDDDDEAKQVLSYDEDALREYLESPLVACLGHQCDSWVIGNKKDVEAMIKDLIGVLSKNARGLIMTMTIDEFDKFLKDNSVLDSEEVATTWGAMKHELMEYGKLRSDSHARRDKNYSGMLFFGNGDFAQAQAFDLVRRLIEAFEQMSRLQQGPTEKGDWEGIHTTAEDIYTALTGQIITDVINGYNISRLRIQRSKQHVREAEREQEKMDKEVKDKLASLGIDLGIRLVPMFEDKNDGNR